MACAIPVQKNISTFLNRNDRRWPFRPARKFYGVPLLDLVYFSLSESWTLFLFINFNAVQRSDLPFGSEFSPSQIELVHVLELAKENGGDWKAFEEAIRKEYFDKYKTSDYNKRKLANNTKLGMKAYRLINEDASLTEFGEKLYSIRHDQERLYQAFARHILLNLHGTTLVQCVQDMYASGERVDLVKLRQWLEERGVHFPSGGKHPSVMRLWLEKVGVFVANWHVDEARNRDGRHRSAGSTYPRATSLLEDSCEHR